VRQSGGGALAIQVPQAPAYRGPSIPDANDVWSGRALIGIIIAAVALLAALVAFYLGGGFRERPRVPLKPANPIPTIPSTSLYVDPAASVSTAAPVAPQAPPQAAATITTAAASPAVPSASAPSRDM
jgi:hypothetical protein